MPLQSAALDNTTREFFFNSCEWGVDNPWEWMYQYANSWRSGPDHHDNWDSTEHIIEHNVGLSKYAGKFFFEKQNNGVTTYGTSGPTKGWNDLDFIMTGGQVRFGNLDLHVKSVLSLLDRVAKMIIARFVRVNLLSSTIQSLACG